MAGGGGYEGLGLCILIGLCSTNGSGSGCRLCASAVCLIFTNSGALVIALVASVALSSLSSLSFSESVSSFDPVLSSNLLTFVSLFILVLSSCIGLPLVAF